MRRRNISDLKEIEEIISKCQWCHLGMTDLHGLPYLVPMNFGYRRGIIYMHGADQGRKISCMLYQPNVCVNFSTDHQLRYQSEQVACSWSMRYRSVLAWGKVEFIEDLAQKSEALDIIMAQYSDRSFHYNPPSLREVKVWKIVVNKFEGRAFGL